MPKFIEIGGSLRDKCYVQIPDNIWDKMDTLTQKQVTEAVEKGLIADAPGGIGIKKSPRYHISIKSDYRLCAQLKAAFASETVRSSDLSPYASPYANRTPATASEQERWFREEQTSKKDFDRSQTDVTIKIMTFDREKDHATLSSA